MNKRIDASKIEIGDYIKFKAGTYNEWRVVTGKGHKKHVTPDGQETDIYWFSVTLKRDKYALVKAGQIKDYVKKGA